MVFPEMAPVLLILQNQQAKITALKNGLHGENEFTEVPDAETGTLCFIAETIFFVPTK